MPNERMLKHKPVKKHTHNVPKGALDINLPFCWRISRRIPTTKPQNPQRLVLPCAKFSSKAKKPLGVSGLSKSWQKEQPNTDI